MFSREQLAGLTVQIRLLDDGGHAVPGAMLELRAAGSAETLYADNAGSVTLVLTEARLVRDPEVLAWKNGTALGTSARLFGTVELGGAKPVLIDVARYRRRFSDSVAVLYQPSDSTSADSLLALLREQRTHVRQHVPAAPIPWGIVLADTPPPFQLLQTTVADSGVEYQLFVYWTGEWRTELYRDNYMRYVKNCLFAAVQRPPGEAAEWLFGGLPRYWEGLYLLDHRDDPALPAGPLVYSEAGWRTLDSMFRARAGRPFPLLDWRPAAPEEWLLGFACYRAFWMTVAERYGDAAIAGFLADLRGIGSPSQELYRETLVRHTGPEVSGLMAAFPLDTALQKNAEIHRAVDGR
jgi:hypothetical protein